MIVEWLLHNSWGLWHWIMSFIPADLVGSDIINEVFNYTVTVFDKGGDIFFLFVPPDAFKTCIDILFFYLIHTPGWDALMWALRKIPFLGIE